MRARVAPSASGRSAPTSAAGVVGVERLERDRGRVPPRGPPRRPPVEELRPGERGHEERRAGPRLDDVLDEIKEAVARPVEVLEHEEGRCGRGEPFDSGAPGGEELLALARADLGREAERRPDERRDALRLARLDATLAEPARDDRDREALGRDREESGEQSTEREVRDRRAKWEALRGRDAEVRARRTQLRRELLDEPRLPGARGRADRDELRPRLIERALCGEHELREVGRAADERPGAPARRRVVGDRLEGRTAHRLRLALEVERARRAEPKAGAGRVHRPRADHDLARHGGLLQPRRHVHRVAGDEEVAAWIARCDHLSGIDADPQPEGRGRAVSGDGIAERDGRAERAIGIVVVGPRHAEDGHDRVADELLERAATLGDHARGDVVVRGHERADILWIARVRERRRAGDVGEEDRDDAALFRHGREPSRVL